MNKDLQNCLDLEQWDRVLEILSEDNRLVSEVDAEYLAMKNFQYALVANGNEAHIFSYANQTDLTRTISFCRQKGLLAQHIPAATSFQDIKRIETLLADGHPVDEHSFGERTGLIIAAALNNTELVKFFLSKGALVLFCDYDNCEAIDYTNNPDIKAILKSAGGKTKEERKQDYDDYCNAKEELNNL